MSADNGIYILESKDGFRVLHAQAIENMYWFKDPNKSHLEEWRQHTEAETDAETKQAVTEYWQRAPFFATKQEALQYASDMEQAIADSECPVLEYGISIIRVPFAIEH